MTLLHILGFVLILVSPICLGLPWIPVGGAKSAVAKMCFAYVAGYFLRHTLFHLIGMPMILAGVRFSVFSNIFTVALAALSIFSFWRGRKQLSFREEKSKLAGHEIVYLIVCISLLAVQVYITVFMDPTHMAMDDSTYTVYSSDALASDYMMITDPYTGVFAGLNHRFMQTSLLFPAYIARMTGMPVTMAERTFGYTVNLVLAYACYFFMAEDLYKKRENRYIFLIFVSLLYLFGYYSHYSMTFRLLGPNSQGKAILAVTLVPLLFVLFRKRMNQSYDRKFGVLLLLLSDAACALSLMGAGYMICIVIPMTVLSLFGTPRYWKQLLYCVWGCALPCVYIFVYLFMRYRI